MFWFILSDFLTQNIPLCGFRTFYEFRVVLHSGKKIKEGTRQLPCTQSNAFLTFHLVFSDNKVRLFSACCLVFFHGSKLKVDIEAVSIRLTELYLLREAVEDGKDKR